MCLFQFICFNWSSLFLIFIDGYACHCDQIRLYNSPFKTGEKKSGLYAYAMFCYTWVLLSFGLSEFNHGHVRSGKLSSF